MKDDTKKTKEEIEEVVEEEETEVEGNDEVEELKQKVGELENNYKRALADYQNLQRRVNEERGEWLKASNRELLLRVLPILDTLMLGFKHTQSADLKVMIGQFLDVLKSEQVTKIDTKDKDFDPQLMEVIEIAEGKDGKVLEEVRTGFMIYDKLLRPAQVKVGGKIES